MPNFEKTEINKLQKDENILVAVMDAHSCQVFDNDDFHTIELSPGDLLIGVFCTIGWNVNNERFFIDHFIFQDQTGRWIYPHTDKCRVFKFDYSEIFSDLF